MSASSEKKSAVFLLVILAIIIGVLVFITTTLKVDPIEESLSKDPVLKTLFVLKNDKDEAISTNVLVIYPTNNRAVYVDIPENVGAIYQSLGRVDKISAVYKEKGIDVYRDEIEKLLGKEIPFVFEITVSDFSLLVDLLGGLNIFIPDPIDITGPGGEKWLLPNGNVSLDGDKIHTYINYRIDNDTFEFSEERREFIFSAFLTAFHESRSKVFDNKSFAMFADKFHTNMELDNMESLLRQISEVDTDTLVVLSVTGARRIVDGNVLSFPRLDGQFIKDTVNQNISLLVNGDTSRIYELDIKNGTTTQGLARNARIMFEDAGYKVLEAVNADRNDYPHTTIINHIGNAEAAKSLGNFINCLYIVDEAVQQGEMIGSPRVDFTIILGKDFDGRYVRGGYTGESKE